VNLRKVFQAAFFSISTFNKNHHFTPVWCDFQVPKCTKFKTFPGLCPGPRCGSLQRISGITQYALINLRLTDLLTYLLTLLAGQQQSLMCISNAEAKQNFIANIHSKYCGYFTILRYCCSSRVQCFLVYFRYLLDIWSIPVITQGSFYAAEIPTLNLFLVKNTTYENALFRWDITSHQ